MVELEYIARSDFDDDALQKKIKEAKTQLTQYVNDPRIQKIAQPSDDETVDLGLQRLGISLPR